MPQDDPFAKYGGTAVAAQPTQTPDDPFKKYGGSTLASETPTSDNSVFSKYGGSSVGVSSNSGTEQPESSSPWYKKAWDWSNTPLIDLHREGAGGFESGLEDIASGFTSPLSLVLTIGTLGSGGLIESAGAQGLKAAGMGIGEIAEFSKAADVAKSAIASGTKLSTAFEAAKINPEIYQKGMNALLKTGLTTEDVTNKELIARGGASLLRKLGIDGTQAAKVARGVQAMVNTGFTIQQANQCIQDSPRVLDALKEGDYETAKRLGVDALAGGLLGGIGATHAMHDAGEIANTFGKFRPTEDINVVRQKLGVLQADEAVAAGKYKQLESGWRKELGPMSDQQLGAIMFNIEASGNKTKLASRINALSDATNRPDLKVPVPETEPRVQLGKPVDIEGVPTYPITVDGKPLGEAKITKEGSVGSIEWLGKTGGDKDVFSPYGELSNTLGIRGVREIARQYKAQNPEVKTLEGMRVGGKSTGSLKPVALDLEKLVSGKDVESSGTDADRMDQLIREQRFGNSKNYTDKQREELINTYKAALNLTPKQEQIKQKIQDFLSDGLARAQAHNVIQEGVDNYQLHRWGKDKNEGPANVIKHQASNGNFSTNVSMARQRLFDSAFEGQMLGKKLETNDPIALAAYWGNTVDRAIAARKFANNFHSAGLRMSDGRPMAVLAGSGHLVEGSSGEDAAVLVDPNRIRSKKIASPVVERMKKTGDLDRFLADGSVFLANADDVKAGETPIYTWSHRGYVSLDHPAFRDWNFAAHSPEGTPVMVKADMRFHPEIAEYVKRALGLDKSQLRENPVGKAALTATSEAKSALLSFSPFHVLQEGLRAIMTGINPFGFERPDYENDVQLRRGLEHGVTFGKDYHSIQDYSDGVAAHSKIISSIPGIGRIQDSLHTFLFDKYIPSLKMRAYRNLEARYGEKYGADFTPGVKDAKTLAANEKAMHEAATDTNERFGGINYRQLGRSAASQDWFRLAALAPDWLESELRFTARLFGKEGSIARQDVARIAAMMWATSRVLNYVTSGKPHNEAPFGVAFQTPDGEKVYSVRTLPTDMLHMATDPLGFLRGRASPLLRAGSEVYTGREDRGHRLTPGEMAIDIARNVAPIPTQGIANPILGNTGPDQVIKAAGLTVQAYKTNAEKLAGQLASDRQESGPIDREQLGRHNAKISFTDDVRSGKMSAQQIHGLVENGSLSVREGKEIIKSAELTPLQARASNLPMKDFLDVYQAGTDQEKAELAQLFLKKRSTYLKSARKEMSPAQLLADPTYNKLKNLAPMLPPW